MTARNKQRVAFPSFRIEEQIKPYDMRQLVAALEYRFQSLEDQESIIPDTSFDDELDNIYAPIVHNHVTNEIIDFDINVPSSVFDLDDVNGAPSPGDVLIWDGDEFLPGTTGASISLNDLTDVSVPTPTDTQILSYVTANDRWEAVEAPAGASIDTLFELNDTDLSSQTTYAMLFNADGTEWQDTAGALRWNPFFGIELTHDFGIWWEDTAFTPVELLEFDDTDTFVAGDPTYPTKIDGTLVGLRNNIGLNWEDIIGDDVELLHFSEPSLISWPALSTFSTTGAGAVTELGHDDVVGMRLNDDGKRLYMCWDVGTSELIYGTPNFAVAYVPDDITGDVVVRVDGQRLRDMCWNDDGTKVYFAVLNNFLREFNNTGTPYNPGNGDLTFVDEFGTGAQTPRSIEISSDGTKLWYVSNATGRDVFEVDLGTPYDITTAVAGNSFSPTEGDMIHVRISPDGLRMYLLGFGSETLYDYTLGTAFDITTASFVSSLDVSGNLNGDGNHFEVVPDGLTLLIGGYSGVSAPNNETQLWTSSEPGAVAGRGFIVGDPVYPTQIDGTILSLEALTRIDIPHTIGINWDNAAGVPIEHLVFEESTGPSSDFGTDPSADWTYFGEVGGDVALKATGIIQDAFGGNELINSGFSFSDDGLHCIAGNTGNDKVWSYTFTTPYDVENATSDYPTGQSFTNANQTQYVNSGNHVILAQTNGGVFRYPLSPPYVAGVTSPTLTDTASLATLGYVTGAGVNFYMSRDGTKFLTSGDKAASITWLRMWDVGTPYSLSTLAFANELNVDATFAAAAIRTLTMADDGLSFYILYKGGSDAIYLYEMTAAFDLTTATLSGTFFNLDTAFSADYDAMQLSTDASEIYVVGRPSTFVSTVIRLDRISPPAGGPADGGLIVGDPVYPTKIDGTLLSLEALTRIDIPNAIGMNWDDFTGNPVEHVTFDASEVFILGDPAYKTHIDGTLVELEDTIGINWKDLLGVPVEMLSTETTSTGGDPHWASVALLANFDGADADTSYTSEDTGLRVATFGGSAELDTAQFKFGTTSLVVASLGDYITFPDSPDWDIGTNDFTVEFWVQFNGDPGAANMALVGPWTSSGDERAWVINLAGNFIAFNWTTGGSLATSAFEREAWNPAGSIWYNVAVVRDAGLLYFFMDGTQLGTAVANTANIYAAAAVMEIGSLDLGTTQQTNGWIEEVRFTNGVGRYTSDYTPETVAFSKADPASFGTLTVGDPTYTTQIDGAFTDISGELTFLDKMNASVTTVTTTSHTAGAEHVILVDDDTAAATVTVTLPLAATANTIYHVKKLGTTASVIIDGDGSELIDGALTITLNRQYESVMLISDGTSWSII